MSFLNNSFKAALATPESAVSQLVSQSVSSYTAFKNFINWAPVVATQGCVESPTPPAEQPVVEDPQPEPVPPSPDPDIEIAKDMRERPGITSKTTSVGNGPGASCGNSHCISQSTVVS